MVETEIVEGLAAEHIGGTWEATRFGAGRFSETFLLRSRTVDEEYIFRTAPPDDMLQLFYEYRMMRQEPELHEFILSRSQLPVPKISAYDFSRTAIDHDYLIMPRMPGSPLSDTILDPSARRHALYTWGRYIRTLHSLCGEANTFGYIGPHRPMEPRGSWREAFYEMYRLELEDIRRCGIYGPREQEYALSLLASHLESFPDLESPRLCHGDIWVTNLLVKEDGTVTSLIDFDRACWGDPEWDLAIADYCGVTEEAFLQGYGGDPRKGVPEASIRRLFYLLYEHQKYIVISVSSRRNDPQGARRYAEQSLEIMRRLETTGSTIM